MTTAAKDNKGQTPADLLASRAAQKGVQVDGMTARSDGDVALGHFCSIDLSNKKALEAVERQIGEGNARFGNGDYGVLVGVGEVDGDGYPTSVTVLLRDDNACQVSGIPYAALAPAQAGRR